MSKLNLTINGKNLTDIEKLKARITDSDTYAEFVNTDDATAEASDIAEGKTAYVKGNLVTGTGEGGSGISTQLIDGTIKEFTLPENINARPWLFTGVHSLQSANMSNATVINDNTFLDCYNMTDVVLGEHITSIGNYAFCDCRSLEDINLPNSLETIQNASFSGCTGLHYVSIPDNVTSIGENAFYGCTGLYSVTIGGSVETIGSNVFSGCDSLYYIESFATTPPEIKENTLPNTIQAISVPADSVDLYKAASYWSVYADKIHPISTGLAFTSNGDRTCAVTGRGDCVEENIIIPSKSPSGDVVVSVSPSAFYANNSDSDKLSSVILPGTLNSIGNSAFGLCNYLVSITIPASLKTFGDNTFMSDDSLHTVIYYGSLYEWCQISRPNNLWNAQYDLYFGPNVVTNIKTPASIKTISNYTFERCRSIVEVDLSNAVEIIGSWAFAGCPIINIVVGSSLESVGDGAFSDRQSGYTRYVGESVNEETWCSISFGDNNGILSNSDFYLGDSDTPVSEIVMTDVNFSQRAFLGCSSITSVQLSYIHGSCYEAFKDCKNLTTAVLSGTIPQQCGSMFSGCSSLESASIDGVSVIGDAMFLGCSSLTNITIPDSVTSIGSMAFQGCSGLTSINIPDSVTTIGSNTFSGCNNLAYITVSDQNPDYCSIDGILYDKSATSILYVPQAIQGGIIIPDGVTSIGWMAFDGCTGLTSISIPGTISNIQNYTFRGCTALTDVTIGESLQTAGFSAFANCTSLSSITCLGPVFTIQFNTFQNVPANCSIYVQPQYVDSYKSAQYWSNRANYIFPIVK